MPPSPTSNADMFTHSSVIHLSAQSTNPRAELWSQLGVFRDRERDVGKQERGLTSFP